MRRNPLDKFSLIEIASVFLAAIIGIFAMIQGYHTLLLLAFLLISLGLACEAIIYLQKNQAEHAIKQIVRAVCIFIFVTYLLFQI